MTKAETMLPTSRIPMPQFRPKGESAHEKFNTDTLPRKSRLEEMQEEYQQNLLKEKANKMLKVYENSQQRALNKVNTRGKVREFFKESRGQDLNDPWLQQRFIEMNTVETPQLSKNIAYRSDDHLNEIQMDKRFSNGSLSVSSTARSSPSVNVFLKHSQGRDKSSLLDPLRKSTTSQEKSDAGDWSRGFGYIPPIHKHDSRAKESSLRKSQSMNLSKKGAESVSNDSLDRSASSHTLTASLTSRSSQLTPQDGGKISSFQKWKMQNASSQQRFPVQTSDDSEPPPDLSQSLRRKEKQLRAKIDYERLEREAAHLREQQALDAEIQVKEEQMDRKKAAAEEKKRKQEEALQKKKELERQKLEEKRRKEEEIQRKKDQEKERKIREQEDKQRRQQNAKKPVQQRKPDGRKAQNYDAEEEYHPPDPQVDFYANAVNSDDAFGDKTKMAKCSICQRSFAADRIAKHQIICKKADQSLKKRKVFDSTKMRTEGTEQAKYVNQKSKPSKAQPKNMPPKKDWRKQHEEFIESIRYAKKVTEMEKSGVAPSNLPPPPKTDYSDYVQCQYCKKKFNRDVAERHIPKCKNIKSNKPAGRR